MTPFRAEEVARIQEGRANSLTSSYKDDSTEFRGLDRRRVLEVGACRLAQGLGYQITPEAES